MFVLALPSSCTALPDPDNKQVNAEKTCCCLQAAQLAALQERLQEVIALHQHASDECETLRVIFLHTLFVS